MAHGWGVHARIGQCRATFESVRKNVWSRVEISSKTKLRIDNCLIISCLLYGAEIWELTAYQLQRLEAFHVGCLRRILRVPYVQHRTNVSLRMECNSPCVFALIRHRRLAWLGRLARMNEVRLPLRLVHAACPGVTHSHARRRWDKHIQLDLRSASQVCPSFAENRWRQTAADAQAWTDELKNMLAIDSDFITDVERRRAARNGIDEDASFRCELCNVCFCRRRTSTRT